MVSYGFLRAEEVMAHKFHMAMEWMPFDFSAAISEFGKWRNTRSQEIRNRINNKTPDSGAEVEPKTQFSQEVKV